MRRFTMQDRSSGEVTSTGKRLSLSAVYELTDWTEAEFDEIADMRVNDSKVYDSGIYIERTS